MIAYKKMIVYKQIKIKMIIQININKLIKNNKKQLLQYKSNKKYN